MMQFFKEINRITFDKRYKRCDYFWRNIRIVKYKSYNDAYKVVTKIFKECGISSAKVCHFRASGTDLGGFRGLNKSQVATMTKHVIDKLSDVYMSELVEDIMKTMAGFPKNEQWYVGRCYSNMPQANYVELLFPRIILWRQEMHAGFGDKHAYNFLYELLPFLAGVAVQDGIYWLRDFPTHEVSTYLKTQIPGYEQWVRAQLPLIDEKNSNRHQEEINALNSAALGAFQETVRRQEQMERRLADIINQQNQKISRLNNLLSNQIFCPRQNENVVEYNSTTTTTSVRQSIQQHAQVYNPVRRGSSNVRSHVPPHGRTPLRAPILPNQVPPQMMRTCGDLTPHRGWQQHHRTAPTEVARTQVSLGSQVHPSRMLTYNQPEPLRINKFPKSFVELLSSHRLLRLHTLDGVDKSRWSNAVRLAYSKRTYLYKKIVARARGLGVSHQTLEEKMLGAAQLFDGERGGRTLAQFYRHLKDQDAAVCRRAAVVRDDVGEGIGRWFCGELDNGELEQV
jgi:hypothetical protein